MWVSAFPAPAKANSGGYTFYSNQTAGDENYSITGFRFES
jgi:hypothetical protein